ncbi:MAG: hypothetical protein RL095_3953 [Verrucomicrobiota bacterium]|jgi:purine-binding chemotaxis protein CheW
MNHQHAVFFRCGGTLCALPCGGVRELLRSAEGICPLPRSPPGVLGLFNLRGEIITVFHLAQVLALPEEAPRHVLVVRDHGIPVGLAVDEILDIHELQESLLPAPSHLPAALRRCLAGLVHEPGGGLACELDVQAVLADHS